MTDVTFALEAKSDQLNAVDIMDHERIIKIRDVIVKHQKDQPVSIYFDGDNNRPWRPSKGMLRILAGAWGSDSSNWLGKYAALFFEPSVKYAGQEVGGIRIRALSDIHEDGVKFVITLNRKSRQPYYVEHLHIEEAVYPEDKFNEAFDSMVAIMASGKASLQQVIARCEKTGRLSEMQLTRLEEAAPTEISEDQEVV